MSGNDRFNAEAAAWDANPDVHRASDGALEAILAAFPELSPQHTRVLEIGCGTGLLTLRLAPHVASILAIDAAPGMIDALTQKLARADDNAGLRRKIRPLCVLLTDPDDERLPAATATATATEDLPGPPRERYDLITSHLVLHHIADLAALLRTMYGCLRPGGAVALTDYEDYGPAARKFHPEAKMAGVERHGIDARWFAGLMAEAGFVDVEVRAKWTMEKAVERTPGEWGEGGKPPGPQGVQAAAASLAMMGFPFLLCRGRRPE